MMGFGFTNYTPGAEEFGKKSLRDFTDFELYKILCNNEQEDALHLSFICSEYLRRIYLYRFYEKASYYKEMGFTCDLRRDDVEKILKDRIDDQSN